MAQPTDARIKSMTHERRLVVLRSSTPRSHGGSGEAVGPSEKWVGLAAPLGKVGFDVR